MSGIVIDNYLTDLPVCKGNGLEDKYRDRDTEIVTDTDTDTDTDKDTYTDTDTDIDTHKEKDRDESEEGCMRFNFGLKKKKHI